MGIICIYTRLHTHTKTHTQTPPPSCKHGLCVRFQLFVLTNYLTVSELRPVTCRHTAGVAYRHTHLGLGNNPPPMQVYAHHPPAMWAHITRIRQNFQTCKPPILLTISTAKNCNKNNSNTNTILAVVLHASRPYVMTRFFACFHAGYFVSFTREKSRRKKTVGFVESLCISLRQLRHSDGALTLKPMYSCLCTLPPTALTQGASSLEPNAKPPTRLSSRPR